MLLIVLQGADLKWKIVLVVMILAGCIESGYCFCSGPEDDGRTIGG
ncbi:hypothetical protein [Chitinilyticum piscinae]|uniref:Uncharacterized protein n=1 Tax=Chitinilyticum piscinae TaxID=2866724 RepID=A0A8J7K2E6_9NEIS|nr:hypothetical protein [Chitinilyticum piscinae]MBE9609937.1 hypothetical protein [Chitinilyticum piscinae]